ARAACAGGGAAAGSTGRGPPISKGSGCAGAAVAAGTGGGVEKSPGDAPGSAARRGIRDRASAGRAQPAVFRHWSSERGGPRAARAGENLCLLPGALLPDGPGWHAEAPSARRAGATAAV